MSNKFDDIFREQLGDHSITPPPRVWTDMVDDLPLPIPFYKQPAFIVSSTITSLLFLALISYFFLQAPTTTSNQDELSATSRTSYTYSLLPAITKVDRPQITTKKDAPTQLLASNQYPSTPSPNYSDTQPVYHLTTNRLQSAEQSMVNPMPDVEETKSTIEETLQVVDMIAVPTIMPVTTNNQISQTLSPSNPQSFKPSNPQSFKPSVLQTLKPSSVPQSPYYPSFELEERDRSLASGINVLAPTPVDIDVEQAVVQNTIINTTEKDQAVKPTPLAAPIVPMPAPAIEKINPASVLVVQATEEELEKRPLDKESKVPHIADANKLYFGTFGSVHNNWLLANEGLSSAVNNKGLDQMLDFGHAYGFVLGYDITKNFGLQAEWIIKSHQGQKFDTYNAAKRTRQFETDINLVYSQFPLLFKYRRSRYSGLTKQPIVTNWSAGVQYGVLRSAEINADNPIFQQDLLKQSSWGWVFGVDYDIYLSKNYFVTLGARSSLSTTSDSFNQLRFPGPNRTNNLLFGLRGGISYRFNK